MIFVRPFPAGPHAVVLPEDPCMVIKLLEREREVWINDIPQLEITASQGLVLGSESSRGLWRRRSLMYVLGPL